jgi:MOSC domain-containing protein YiiM
VSAPVLISIQVGLPRTLGTFGASDPLDRPWRTAFGKHPVEGRVHVGRGGLDGDGQASPDHGGPEKAVLAYSADHYPRWRSELGIPDLPYGAFGENLTIGGTSEESVCIGDIFQISGAALQVAQPREPCGNISRYWRRRDLTARVRSSGRTGWYLRVHSEGEIAAGLPVLLLERPFPQWTVERANRILHGLRREFYGEAAQLAACPLLSKEWRVKLARRAARVADFQDRQVTERP